MFRTMGRTCRHKEKYTTALGIDPPIWHKLSSAKKQ